MLISIIVTAFLRDSSIFNFKSKNEKIKYVNTKYINYLKNYLKKNDLTNKNVYEMISAPYYSDFSFYIVNKDGDVIVSNKKEVKKINNGKIEDGKRDFSIYRSNAALSEITGCDYLKNGYFLYFVFCGYAFSSLPQKEFFHFL